jgi:predicted O-methyltransferase YrrM
MTGSVEVAQFFQVILKSMGAKRCLELGCYTGYTTLSLALALPDDGEVITCDISDEFAQKNIWKEAGVEHKVLNLNFLIKFKKIKAFFPLNLRLN